MGLMLGTIVIAINTVLSLSTVSVSFASDDDPRSDRACDNMVKLEGKQDARTEPDSTIPDSDRGSQKAHEGSEKAAGDCDLQTP